MLTLYDDVFSPYARKVRLALYEKGIAFERVRAFSDCNRTDFLHVNPRAEVPALTDSDGLALFDSTILCEYLEDRYPDPRLYPREPLERAQCRRIEDLADTQIDAALYAVAVIEFGRRQPHPAMHEAAGRDLQRLYGELERLLGDRPFFCGDFSLADIAVLPHIMAATFLGFALDAARTPALASWLGRMNDRPSVQRDNLDVLETLQKLRKEGSQAFDPYRVQWRSDRLEWVMKNGFAAWFMEELAKGHAFFPLSPAPQPAPG